MTLAELKTQAQVMGITPDMARSYGHIGHKKTWQAAIDATRAEWDAAANDDELDETTDPFGVKGLLDAMAATDAALERLKGTAPTEAPTEPTEPQQYGPELVFIIPALLLILTMQIVWRGFRWAWPPVSRWLYHEGIGALAAAALLLYRPKLA